MSDNDCTFSKRLEGRIVSTEDWLLLHTPHLEMGQQFRREKYDAHPSGTWFWRVCTCGAKHLSTGDER